MEFLRFLHSCIRQYIRETSGAIAVVFALMAPVIVGASGMALDYAQAYLVQQRLAQSLDAAALAAVASSTDEAVIRQKVLDFFEANYGDDERGFAFDPIVTINGDDVTVTGTATYTTFFLRVIGTTEITVEAKTTVEREVQGIEVVLVMDNTGSMATNNNIATLRTAASNFVYIMYGIDEEEAADVSSYDEIDDLATRNSDFIKIGLVPYSTSVNVGGICIVIAATMMIMQHAIHIRHVIQHGGEGIIVINIRVVMRIISAQLRLYCHYQLSHLR